MGTTINYPDIVVVPDKDTVRHRREHPLTPRPNEVAFRRPDSYWMVSSREDEDLSIGVDGNIAWLSHLKIFWNVWPTLDPFIAVLT